jgi:hypothetical protein
MQKKRFQNFGADEQLSELLTENEKKVLKKKLTCTCPCPRNRAGRRRSPFVGHTQTSDTTAARKCCRMLGASSPVFC